MVALGTGACAGDEAECSKSGEACLYAGTGERGYNIENPTAHRLQSKLYYPSDLTFDPAGRAYIVDWNNHRIRRVEADNSLIDVVGTDYEGDGPPEMEDRLPYCAPPGALGTTVALNHPTDARIGPDGRLYIAAWHNNKIRVYDPATDIVVSIAGNGYGYEGDGAQACGALFNQPKTIIFGPDNTLYTIDQRNVRIRAILPDGTIKTFAGVGTLGNGGDGESAMKADFGFEKSTTPRPSGGLAMIDRAMYVADSLNNRIRKIDLDSGIINCVAGDSAATPGYSGDGGPALQATFNFPADLELGPDGRLYIADRYNHVIRAIDPITGIVETVAGRGTKCNLEQGEDCPANGPALSIGLNEPYGLSFDPNGNMYIADTNNNRIIKVVR